MPDPLPALLVLAESTGDAILSIWIAVGVIFLLAVLLGVFAVYLRRRADPSEAGGEGFTLADVRRMHREGQLSDEEYESAKAALIGGVTTGLPDEIEPDSDEGLEQEASDKPVDDQERDTDPDKTDPTGS